MITKAKKREILEEGKQALHEAQVLLFTDFAGTKVSELRDLKKLLKEVNAKFKVIKKRLFRIALEEKGIGFDPLKFEGQVGTIFGTGEISEIIQPVYQFSKDHPNLKLLGGLDILKKEEIPQEIIIALGKLPSRQVLLAQLMGAMTAPLKGLMYILQEKSKTGQ